MPLPTTFSYTSAKASQRVTGGGAFAALAMAGTAEDELLLAGFDRQGSLTVDGV